ncbi:UDP-3-O-(3-hydroxymyristoyl)glucosamine N-acyltransferase [Pampinifervens florentissimum]|uniref:UDP-3-O-(3-hydroxymyristoyl)glucosamine N-acyltransferase n=1 Tax=Pampinifervens florentissimum TaxID=1632019 RepID=UPI0013B4871B|nr:UDP-3-O-(3-hydroxymyristoyl)glucosamine N-acyltransferase [Hydrogenobacter sp. T-8]QID32876.1 UDP-3-O-(3-hydroxymyristoyl)glucosamine N-acyltransferase [Hydrogenobacter sp. T-8]
MKLLDLAELLEGEVFGTSSLEVEGISSPENPKKGTVVFLQNVREAERLREMEVIPVVSQNIDFPTYIKVKDVRLALARFLSYFYPEKHPSGVSDKAYIEDGVRLGKDVYIAPFVYLGKNVVLEDGVKVYPFCYIGEGVRIGRNSVLFSGVHVYPYCVIGEGVRIHSGSVIGADGFGYYVGPEGIIKLNHIGKVVIEDKVEIGANTCIDRALIDQTVIGENTKIDNLVQVGHNCKIGEGNLIVSQVGLSGSVRTGREVILAGQVGVADHVEIGDKAVVSAKAGVSKNLEGGKVYGGTIPAMEWSRWKRLYAYILKLPDLFKEKRHEDKDSPQP